MILPKKRNNIDKLPASVKELFPFERKYCDIDNGNSLCYIDEGSGPPLVFIHACPMYSFEFRLAIFCFSKHFRVIAYDQMGFGFSDIPQAYDYKVCNHVNHLARLLRKLDIQDNVTLVMHGRGATIGLGFAVLYQKMIRAMIVMNAPSLSDFHLAWRLSMFRHLAFRSLCFNLFHFILSPPLRLPPGIRSAYSIGISRKTKTPFFHFIESLPTAPEDMPARYLSEIECSLWELRERNIPVLLLWADRDWLYNRRDLKKWQSYFPNAEYRPIHSAGRFAPEQAPHEFLSHLKEFLYRVHHITEENDFI